MNNENQKTPNYRPLTPKERELLRDKIRASQNGSNIFKKGNINPGIEKTLQKKGYGIQNYKKKKHELKPNEKAKTWLKKHKGIALTALALAGLTIIPGTINCVGGKTDIPDGFQASGSYISEDQMSYESGDIVYIIIKKDGHYDENKLKLAYSNNKKIGVIIEPNENTNFTDKIIAQIYSIIAQYRIDLPILYDASTLKDNMDKNIKIAKELFNRFDKYSLYVGFYGSFEEIDNFMNVFGDDASKYDVMFRDISSEDLKNIDANMAMYDDKISVYEGIVDVIANTSINDLEEYTIKPGETLETIAQRYNISVNTLADINNISNLSDVLEGTILVPSVKIEYEYNNINSNNVKGVDISSCQGQIDGKKLKNDGLDFAIIRICDCYTSTLSENYSLDSQFQNNVNECLENNIPFAVYYYTRAKNAHDAELEATFIRRNLKALEESLGGVKIPLYIDIESDTYFEPQQNIDNLYNKLYDSDNLNNKVVYMDDDMRTVMQASTIIDSLYNYFDEYHKGVFNGNQIINTNYILKEFLDTNKLYYYDDSGNKCEITEYIGWSTHGDKQVIYDLVDNVKIEKTNDGYQISINRFNSDGSFSETDKTTITFEDMEIINNAANILKNRTSDFITSLEECYSPELIINTIKDTLGDAYEVGIYSSPIVTSKLSNWNSNLKYWVTSPETYNDEVYVSNWNINDLSLDYDWANVLQYSSNGKINGTESNGVDVNISTKKNIQDFVSSDSILGYDANVDIFESSRGNGLSR